MKTDYSTHLMISYGLWLFWGIFGAHRFFNRHWISGILMAATGGLCGIWWLCDLILMPSIVKEHLREVDGTR